MDDVNDDLQDVTPATAPLDFSPLVDSLTELPAIDDLDANRGSFGLLVEAELQPLAEKLYRAWEYFSWQTHNHLDCGVQEARFVHRAKAILFEIHPELVFVIDLLTDRQVFSFPFERKTEIHAPAFI